jgi:hypothetical protein
MHTLDLSDTGMTDDGASALFAAMKTQEVLQRLLMANNKVTDVGGILLANLLKTNTNLVVLSSRNNELKDETAEALLEAMQTNTSLADVDVGYNDFSYRICMKLAQVIEEHKRSLNSNAEEVAIRHVEWLKQEEQRLLGFREAIKQEEAIVHEVTDTRDGKLSELEQLKQVKGAELGSAEAELQSTRDKYETVSDDRRTQMEEFNQTKMQLEVRQTHAVGLSQSQSSKKQGAQVKKQKLEASMKDKAGKNAKEIEALNKELEVLKEQIVAAIEMAEMRKKMLLDEEAPDSEHIESAKPKSRRKSKVKRPSFVGPTTPRRTERTAAERPKPKTPRKKSTVERLASDLVDGDEKPIVRPKTALARTRK